MLKLLKNPMTIWFKWYLKSKKLQRRNKNLKIGYMSTLNNVSCGNYNTIYSNVLIDNTKLGNFVYVGGRTEICNASIGNFCSIAPDVKIGLGMHPTNFISTFPTFFSTRRQCQITFAKKNYFEEIGKVQIGNDVWIGANVIILDNVSIGNGAIIAAGAVVTKDVEPYSIVGGIPAKLIKKRFSESEIKKLESSKWWNKSNEWLEENFEMFNNPSEFFKKLRL
ncbi:CatB-related O-acetyltransferase [Marinifilum sp. D714]|uniref:CatB-related O-acetyltransferase n=1 Tax=Marinifilum sp. D714 TaxID=2937523 RepID=UPI0027BC9511|nr:CatB-related O-acetyltransferase [Marinifilum sp. D714]MDQ2179822.1 CatB-related O-acetyltransferase [Marinifilum sp. D714]